MKLLVNTKKDKDGDKDKDKDGEKDKDKDGENVRKLESVEVVLVHCNLVKNDYQHTS